MIEDILVKELDEAVGRFKFAFREYKSRLAKPSFDLGACYGCSRKKYLDSLYGY